ncbi:PhoH family protein [Brevibacillus sp. WF146]|uniref:PhoH family protein n=1 Tax=Brevibacillus sp. WF146 TaxID=319501 RepID=UPI0007ECC267|nr:PhoH family protein [Brevibacillus sp. WF146]UYZ12164.1 PhoH family protein [Brevibacillus sp. WF146]
MPLPRDHIFFGLGPKLTDEQREYVDSIFDRQLTICNAKAGTGKTTLAVAAAKLIGKPLLYVFNPTEERRMGYRPGTQEEKESAYVVPLMDALLAINENPAQAIVGHPQQQGGSGKKYAADHAWVTAKSHVFARGTNIRGMTVIVDEAQNFTRSDLRKVLTRIHDDCTVVLIGHTGQCDLVGSRSGFADYIKHFRDKPYAKVCELTRNFRGRLATDADAIEEAK